MKTCLHTTRHVFTPHATSLHHALSSHSRHAFTPALNRAGSRGERPRGWRLPPATCARSSPSLARLPTRPRARAAWRSLSQVVVAPKTSHGTAEDARHDGRRAGSRAGSLRRPRSHAARSHAARLHTARSTRSQRSAWARSAAKVNSAGSLSRLAPAPGRGGDLRRKRARAGTRQAHERGCTRLGRLGHNALGLGSICSKGELGRLTLAPCARTPLMLDSLPSDVPPTGSLSRYCARRRRSHLRQQHPSAMSRPSERSSEHQLSLHTGITIARTRRSHNAAQRARETGC